MDLWSPELALATGGFSFRFPYLLRFYEKCWKTEKIGDIYAIMSRNDMECPSYVAGQMTER